MNVEMPYGETVRTLIAPGAARVDLVLPRTAPPLEDPAAALAEACDGPIESAPLAERVAGVERVTVVVSDITRSPATRVMLPLVVERLAAHGVDPSAVRVLVARGTHRKMTKEERRFFREGALQAVALEEHDCDDTSRLSALLLTHRGTPVRVHRAVREADLVVIVSPVSFHYFAGFGGGPKLILPGCSDRQAILANHRLSLRDTHPVTLDPLCGPGNLDGNPVHEDMVEAARALEHLFAINFFSSPEGGVAYVDAGDVVDSHAAACDAYYGRHAVPTEVGRVVVASAGGWPYDINLLQAHKALYHAARAAAEGARILLYARCAEGVGSASLQAGLAAPRDRFLDKAREEYDLNNQTAVSLLALTRRFRVAMVTELDDAVLANAGITRCENVEVWLAEALEEQRSDRIVAVRTASTVLPVPAD